MTAHDDKTHNVASPLFANDNGTPQDPSPALNWDTLKERMRKLDQRLQAHATQTPEQIQQQLQQRAIRLAARPPAEQQEAMLELLVFELSEELYAIETRHVEAVVPLRQLTPIPCTPPFVLGVVNVRGRVRSVLDLRQFFELPRSGLSDLNSVVLLAGADMEFCLLSDRVMGHKIMPESELQPALAHLTGIRTDYLLGVTHRHWAVLDGDKLLRDTRIIVNDI